MLDVCLLGTAGMMPLPKRWLTSCLLRYNGHCILIDCGEGTQIALREAGFSSNPVDVILFTHFHADHISGLPGFLLSMGNSDRTEPLTIIGPAGLTKVVNCLRVIAQELPFSVNCIEIDEEKQSFNLFGMNISAFRVNHNVVCYGYSVDIPRAGKFNLQVAQELGLPVSLWNPLQKGKIVEFEGKTYTPDMVMGEARKGLKVTYSTDTRPCNALIQAAKGSDLLIAEGMYAEPGMEAQARQKKHMTFYEAAEIAKKAEVQELWLTHFSPSLVSPKQYMAAVKDIFPGAVLGKDGMLKTLLFEEEDE